MIPIEVQCDCGQRYAFEVESADENLHAPVACPTCGTDGTVAANAAIAQSRSQPQPRPMNKAGAPRVRVTLPASTENPGAPAPPARTAHPGTRLPGQLDRDQAEHEARAKILWGDPPSGVLGYLMIQGFSAEEAAALVQEMVEERIATIRGNGVKNIVVGSGLVAVPVAAYLIFLGIGIIYLKIMVLAVMAGVWGMWKLSQGIFMVVAPKAESGDASESE